MPKQSIPFRLLRGPILVLGVSVSLLWPYISVWSLSFTFQISALLFGLILMTIDSYIISTHKLRDFLSNLANRFVLDDFLRMLHDPQTGLIPNFVGSFVGASSMYGLRMDNEQKTTLLQASLWATKEEARSILFDAGGCKALLPKSMQCWIDGPEEQTVHEFDQFEPPSAVDKFPENGSEMSDSECQDCSFEVSPPATPDFRRKMGQQDGQKEFDTNGAKPQQADALVPPPGIPVDPMIEMVRIARDMVMDKVKPLIASIPETKLETLAGVAAVGLCSHFLLGFRSQRSALGSLCSMCLSGTVLGSFSVAMLRHAVLGSIHDIESLKVISRAVLLRSFERMKILAKSNKKFQGALAFIVLALVGNNSRGARQRSSSVRSRFPTSR